MPTYRLTAPDGKVYNVTGEGTGEEALAQLQQQLASAPPQKSAPSAVESPQTPAEDEPMGDRLKRYLKEAGGGALYAGQRASAGLTGMLPRPVEEFLVKKGLSPSQEQLDASKKFVADTGPASTIGQMGADIGMQLLPSSLISKAAVPLTMARGVAANLAGQGGLNAALTPTSEGRGEAAVAGAGAAGLGMGVARALGGPLRTIVSPEAKKLIDAGIPLTPGQAVSGPNDGVVARGIRTTEDQVGSIPLLGDVIRAKARNAANAFSTGEINKALAPIGAKVEGVGHDAIEAARDKISQHYNNVLPDIHVPVSDLHNLVNDALVNIKQTNPMFSTAQEEAILVFDGRRIQELAAQGADLTGETAKKLDQELGQFIRKYGKKQSVYDQDMSAAFSEIRNQLRARMVGTTPEARQALKDADKSRAMLQSILDAADEGTGEFTAKALNKATVKAGGADKFRQAAASVLPTITPDSGTAGRTAIGNLVSAPTLGAGAAGMAAGGIVPAALAAAGAASLYTKPGMAGLTQGATPMVNALRNKLGRKAMTPEEFEQLVQFTTSQPIRARFNAKGD